ncbi:MAG: recombinase, partial [Pseudomonas sp.]|nr:recombinase [Pseudomonas sp.]
MLDSFAEYLQSQGRAPATIKGYCADLVAFSRWFEQSNGESLAPQAVGEAFVVTPSDIREYKQFLMTKNASPATVNRHLAAIRAWIAWARANGLTDYNPANGIKDVEQQKLAPQWLDKRQQAALLKELERDLAAARTEAAKRQAVRDQAMVILFLNTGLRVSELCSLELGSITISERKGEIRVMGKGEKARTVPLNNAARSVLREWLNLRPEGRQSEAFVVQVFVGKKGEPITPSGVHRRLSEL